MAGTVDHYIEARFPDGVQVVREPLGELLNGVHVEGQAEILGQPFDGDEKVTSQDPLDGFLVQKIQLVSFKEGCLVRFGHVESRAFPIGLQRVAVSLEECSQDRGDRI